MRGYADWERITSDGIVVQGPAILYSISGNGTVAGAVGTVYEGLDTSSGRLFLILRSPVNQNRQISFDPGVLMDRGIYVDMDSNGIEMLLSYQEIDGYGVD